MYDFVDRPLTSLGHGGRFLVWSMRIWVKAMHDGRCPCFAVGSGFTQWRLISGLPDFHMMMTIFNRDGLQHLLFCAVDGNRVSEHEALILSLVQAVRTVQPAALHKTLALVVAEDAIANLTTALMSLGGRMAGAGILLDQSGSPVAQTGYHNE